MTTVRDEVRNALNQRYNDDATPESVAEFYTSELVKAFENADEDPELLREALENELE